MKLFLPQLCSLLLLLLGTVVHAGFDHGVSMTKWLKAHPDGFLHDHLEIRAHESHGDEDNSNLFGMYVNQDIPAKTVLFRLPRDLLFVPDLEEIEEDEPQTCATARTLYHMLQDAKEQGDKYEDPLAPYVQYLKDQPHGQLPSAWSEAGKEFLGYVMGDDPDFAPFGLLTQSFASDCIFQPEDVVDNAESFELLNHAYLMVLQRGWDEKLLPVYDMLSHANGKTLLNTYIEDSVHDETKDVVVYSKRTIKAGEQLYTTYDMCEDCGLRWDTYGAPEMLRDYGFVEQYPQRWIFGYDDVPMISFVLDQETPDAEVTLEWLTDGYEEEFALRIVSARLKRLQELDLEPYKDKVPENEYTTTVLFHKAAIKALSMCVDQAQTDQEDIPISTVPEECSTDGSGYDCNAREYDNLLQMEREVRDFESYQCFFGRTMEFPGYEDLEVERSQYQEMYFYQDPDNKDTCFNLDTIVQMCGSYRPHYHELVVHNTARYVPEVKRVVWVGGGDSMLLHEILKYPSLELVVGLEIDQKVTRKSFKHFGTQPHWDNEKVQWWYGDASKSLLMLPKEYFGSFDMVLVDLSETITSALVTEGLDIMAALGLLLQPEGILVKNEVYFEKMSSIFDHTIQVKLLDIPVICTQAMSMGSPGLDFVNRKPTDHGIDNLVINSAHKQMQDDYALWHDYYKNEESSFRKHCRATDEPEPEPTEQLRSPGILMVLEAEDTSMDLKTPKMVQESIEKALEKEGFNVVSKVTSEDKGAFVIVTILKEGYVVSRIWSMHKYISFDLFLWSRFEKHEAMKNAIISTVGSKTSSSYRIVTGGMFGVSTWKDDEQKRGPVYQPCNFTEPVSRGALADRSAVDSVISESLSLLQSTEPVVSVVICPEEPKPCKTLDVVSKHEKIESHVIVRACSGVNGGNSQEMVACEMDTWKALLDTVRGGKKLGALVLDDAAPYFMAQVVLKIFLNHKQKEEVIGSDLLVLAPMLDSSESWRRNFLHRFGQDVFVHEPDFRSQILFNSTDGSMEMGVTAFGDKDYIKHVLSAIKTTEEKSGLVSDVRSIEGGIWRYYADFEPSQFLLPGDYDQRSPLKQWKSQQPLGRETVLQFEMQPIEGFEKGDRVEGRFEESGEWFPAFVAASNGDGTFDLRYDDGDFEKAKTISDIRKLVSFRKGDRVLANFEEAGTYFPGTIDAVNDDGTFDVRYIDQDFESGVDRSNIRGPKEAPKKSAIVEPTPLSSNQVKEALQSAFTSVDAIHEYCDIGDGCVFVVFSPGGSAIGVWDGRTHVDVNLFTYNEDVSPVDEFQKQLIQQIPFLQLILKDEQPRGFGRVVNFSRDIQHIGATPHWALDILAEE